MNIAIFASQFYPHAGGAEETVRQLAHSLQVRGDRSLIITNRCPESLAAIEKYEGLTVHRYAFCIVWENLFQPLRLFLHRLITLNRICSDLRAHKIDLIHIQCAGPNTYYALLAKRRLKLPLVVTLLGELAMDETGLYQRSAFARRLLRMTLDEADAITACSGHTLKEAEKFFNMHFGKRGYITYSGVLQSDFLNITPYQHARPYILAIGRLVPQKGLDILLRAFAILLHTSDQTHDLIIAGGGSQLDSLKGLTAELGISNRVRFLGSTSHFEAIQLYAGCSFLVMPSRAEEGLGIVILEAMASGKAVITSRVGGIPEVVQDGQTGLLVPPEDINAFTKAMLRLISDIKFRQQLGDTGRLFVFKNFNWAELAKG